MSDFKSGLGVAFEIKARNVVNYSYKTQEIVKHGQITKMNKSWLNIYAYKVN